MKKTLKKVCLRKPEAERSQTEKIVRDVTFLGVVIVTAVCAYFRGNAELQLANAEIDFASTSVECSMAHA